MMSAFLEPIYLSENLDSLTLEDLKRFAGLLGITPAQSSKARLIRDLPEALNAGIKGTLTQRLSSYPCDDLAVILALEECGGFLGNSIRENALSQLSIDSSRFHPLMVDIRGNGDLRIFAEFIPYASLLCESLIRLKSANPPDISVTLTPETLFNDIYSIWASLSKRPLKLTKNDAPKKRQLDDLISLLLVNEDDPGLASLQSLFEISRFEMLFTFMQRRRILRVNGNLLEANPVFISRVAPDLPEVGRLLIEMTADRESAAAVATIILLLKISDEWISAKELFSQISKTKAYCDEKKVREFLFALFVTGYISVGRKGRSIFVRRERDFLPFSTDEFWIDEPDIIIGSNFEIKVPANTEPSARVKIEAFADMLKPDLFYDYEITKDSVYRALDDGISANEIIGLLHVYSKRPIPQNVEFAIRNWERQFGSIGFEKGLFLVSGDKATVEELAGLSEISNGKNGITELFGIRLDESDYDRVRDYLRRKGFLPRSLPRTVQSRSRGGDVSSLFRGYDSRSKAPKVSGLDKQSLLIRSIEFVRDKGGNIRLELYNGETVSGEPISLKRSHGETTVRVDCGGEIINVILSEVTDFTLD